MPDSVKAELRQNLYESVRAVSGQGGPISYYPEARRPKGIIEQIKGPPAKMGFYQYEVLRRRQNLVGRGTIIPEPKLAIDEVGLPQEMSWKLFEKFVMRRLVNQSGMSPAEASEEVSKRSPVAESALRGEMADRPVLLNRAPSLHKFSIMAFKPRPVAGKAIQIPPMIVKGFNADFDGDTMTVHVPVLPDAVKEAEGMLPSNNLYNPGTGRIMIQPEHEAALGLWMMSKDPAAAKKLDDVLPPDLKKKYRGVELGKKQFNSLMEDLAEQHPRDYGKIVDKLKLIGDDYTYRSGFTVGLKDLVPKIPERDMIARAARAEVGKLPLDTVQGRAKATALMTKANDELTKSVNRRLKQEDNNFHKMVESGARGNMSQLKQIVSTPFMVDDHRGNPTPQPIMKSFSEGLQFSDYWNTLYGARSVVVDKQLQTSKPGAFNKDIMAAAVSNVIADGDCETTDGLMLKLKDSKGRSRRQDTEDRFLAKDVRVGNTTIAEAGSPVTSSLLNTLQDRGIDEIECRSPLTCKLPKGTCARCYGLNEDGNLPAIGDNIGAISGQAMSEPLTQMTMRTFHMGGISGTRGIVTGYEKIDKMLKMHEIKRGKATLAQKGGKIDKVEAAPGGGGRNVFIDGKQHFVETGLTDPKLTRVGRKVRKGDIISKGLVQPQELVDLKGMLDAQNYVAGQVQEAYESQGVPLKRRATETIMRSIGNTTKILDPGESDFIYGDVAPWTVVNSFNDKSLGKVSLPRSVGHILREDVPGAKKGIVIDEKLRNVLERSGKSSVEVGPKPIIHKPFLSGIQRVPLLRQDWMSQMGYRELAKALIQGATKVQESDLHGYSPVPAFAYGAEFGDAPAGASKTKGVY